MTWKKEHPDNDVPRTIYKDERFIDISWKNDACSCFIYKPLRWREKSYIKVWVDYPLKQQRDVHNEKRYGAVLVVDNEYICDLFEATDLDELIACLDVLEQMKMAIYYPNTKQALKDADILARYSQYMPVMAI